MSTSNLDTAPRSAGNGRTDATSFWLASRLVAEREVQAYVRTKSLWVTLALFVVGIFAVAILPGLFATDEAPTVAIVGSEAERAVAGTDLAAQPVADLAAAEELVRTEEVDAAVVPDPGGESALGVRVLGLNRAPDEVVAALSTSPPVDLLDPAEVSETVQYLATFGFAMFFLMFAMSGMAIAQSVVTEKQTRIVEILVATVPVRALLTGKIAGHSLLVFGQVAVLALLTPLALRIGEHGALLSRMAPALGWFVPFFVFGFVLLAAMWAVAGAVVSRQEDLGSTSTLVMGLVMIPYFGVIFLQDNPLAMTILSYVPFSAAVAMPVRLFAGDAQAWEPFLALVVLAVTLVGCVLVATRLYEGSLLRTGGRVTLSQAWSHTR